MKTSPRRLVRALAATAAVLTLTGIAGAADANPAHDAHHRSPATQRTDVDGPDYQKPAIGECHDYGYKVAMGKSDPTAPVKCVTKHTALVVDAFTLPDDLAWPTTDAEESAFYDALYGGGVLKPCATAARKELGVGYKTMEKTAYQWTFYWPTKDQRDHGARWLRCDLNLAGGKTLQTFRGKNAALGTIDKNEKACRVSDGNGGTLLTGCTLRHQYRFAKMARAPFKTYPTDRNKWMRFATHACSSVGQSWWASWPGVSEWEDGNHFVSCFSGRQ